MDLTADKLLWLIDIRTLSDLCQDLDVLAHMISLVDWPKHVNSFFVTASLHCIQHAGSFPQASMLVFIVLLLLAGNHASAAMDGSAFTRCPRCDKPFTDVAKHIGRSILLSCLLHQHHMATCVVCRNDVPFSGCWHWLFKVS